MPFWRRKPKDPGPPKHGPDFSSVDTREKALAMVYDGTLEPLYLLPQAFGGTDDPRNVVYVPLGIAAIKEQTDQNIIAPLVSDGAVSQYAATPEYRGRSFVPMSIQIKAFDPTTFHSEIAIWGEALDREQDRRASDGG